MELVITAIRRNKLRPTRFYSSQQERRVAKAVNGKQTANSGATAWSKGDVTSDLVLLECKTHTAPREQMTVRRDWILKNREEAFQMGKHHSAVVIDFGDGENHYIVSEKDFLYLLERLREEE